MWQRMREMKQQINYWPFKENSVKVKEFDEANNCTHPSLVECWSNIKVFYVRIHTLCNFKSCFGSVNRMTRLKKHWNYRLIDLRIENTVYKMRELLERFFVIISLSLCVIAVFAYKQKQKNKLHCPNTIRWKMEWTVMFSVRYRKMGSC